MSHIPEEGKKDKGWRVREQKYHTLYFEDYISQDRCVKEQPERRIIKPFYLVRPAVLYSV